MTSFSSRYDPRRANHPRHALSATELSPAHDSTAHSHAATTSPCTPLRHGRPHSRGPSCPCHGPQVTVAGVAAASPASHKDPMACTAIRRGLVRPDPKARDPARPLPASRLFSSRRLPWTRMPHRCKTTTSSTVSRLEVIRRSTVASRYTIYAQLPWGACCGQCARRRCQRWAAWRSMVASSDLTRKSQLLSRRWPCHCSGRPWRPGLRTGCGSSSLIC
jgi:bacterioferritin-associated ferredoxin